MAIKIEKGIPLPTQNGHGEAAEIRKAFETMQVGESFFMPIDPAKKSQQSNVTYRARLHGIKVSSRKVTEKGIEGFRVWRVQ